MSRRDVRRRARGSGPALALVALLSTATPALAHPFGPPPTAEVKAAGDTVTIHWRAAVDDMLAIGEHVGVLPPGSVEGVQEGVTQVAPPAAAEEELDRSPALARYLIERIAVYQEGRRCAVTVRPILDFVGRGATTEHRCPETIAVVDLEVTMLHDLHEAYRTFAVDQTIGVRPGQSVHTLSRPRATWDFSGAGRVPATSSGDGSRTPLGWFESDFLALIDRPASSWWFAVVALLVAFGIGAAHALAPGHGKGVAAAYLAGARGRPRDAVLLGVAVAAMHTLSVVGLGLALHALASAGDTLDRVGPWLTLTSGALVLTVGVGSLLRVLRHRRADATHDHDHGQDHEHLPAAVSPLSRRGLLLIGLSGGLLPSPSAFLVLTTALFTGRTLFGLTLVVAFSLGLASTLAVIGLAVVKGRALATRKLVRNPRLTAALDTLPLASTLLITLAGLWLTTTAALNLR